MKITKEFAEKFANDWVRNWNNRDIEAILHHYADSVVFSSPFILKAKINDFGTVQGQNGLRKYFEQALEKNPDLHFDLKHIMVGIKSISLIYVRKKTLLATETMLLNDEGKIVEGLSHYSADELYELL